MAKCKREKVSLPQLPNPGFFALIALFFFAQRTRLHGNVSYQATAKKENSDKIERAGSDNTAFLHFSNIPTLSPKPQKSRYLPSGNIATGGGIFICNLSKENKQTKQKL